MLVREAYILAGPTASGKSDIAAALAREMGAWILSADSMLVYRGMDIGTAKPSPAEREEPGDWSSQKPYTLSLTYTCSLAIS